MRKGFTLVELMVVVALIAILALGYQIFYGGATDKAKVSKSIEFIQALKKSISAYYADTGYYPSKTQQLWSNSAGAPNWYGPYAEAPNGNTSLNFWPHTPWGGAGYLTCGKGSYEALIMKNVSSAFCQQIDKQIDDNNLSKGNIRYDSKNGNCIAYLVRGSQVRCK